MIWDYTEVSKTVGVCYTHILLSTDIGLNSSSSMFADNVRLIWFHRIKCLSLTCDLLWKEPVCRLQQTSHHHFASLAEDRKVWIQTQRDVCRRACAQIKVILWRVYTESNLLPTCCYMWKTETVLLCMVNILLPAIIDEIRKANVSSTASFW